VIAPEAFRLGDGLVSETNGEVRIVFSAKAANCASEQTFVIGIGEGETAAKIETRIRGYARTTSKDSRAASRRWLTKALDKFSFDGVPEDLRLHYAKAVYQTLSNTKAPRGRLRHFVNYPARGVYSAEFLWDACFTNVGVEQFNRKIAEGYLLNIVENQEPDGKMPQFVCATWNRPGESQAPIIGWSAWRLHEKFGNKKLISAIYGPLCRSIEWWFKNRDQDGNGVCEIIGGLECWDDSPRFDLGRVEGVDLNAYLYREMRILAKMATILGKEKEAGAWEQRAERHAAKALSVLFDEETGLYFDRLVEQNRLHKVFTPASFIPLWTGMPVPEKTARTMIRKYLLDPERFFGKYPFPVVAYNDPNCKPGAWWRGPVWPNIAWVMVEILDAYGYDKEAKEATDRLLAMMTAADELYELYHCKTGQPLGCTGYGWTSAVFMDLARRHKEAK